MRHVSQCWLHYLPTAISPMAPTKQKARYTEAQLIVSTEVLHLTKQFVAGLLTFKKQEQL
jgi:hypothetical protein